MLQIHTIALLQSNPPRQKKNVEEKHSAKRFTPAQPTDQPLFYMRKI